jgi:hypothetical protein
MLRSTSTGILSGKPRYVERGNAFAAIVREGPDALLILADRVFLHNRKRMMDFATEQRLPSVNAYREVVEAGGLMSYGPSYEDMHRRAADYNVQAEHASDVPHCPAEGSSQYPHYRSRP